jgi:hypothetical protein
VATVWAHEGTAPARSAPSNRATVIFDFNMANFPSG